MPTKKDHTKEIHREIDYGPDKIHLILQFPAEQFPADEHPPLSSTPSPQSTLRQEIRAILSREISGKALP